MDLWDINGDDGLAVITHAVDGGHRDGLEGHVARRQIRHLGSHGHDVPALIDGQRTLHRHRQLTQLVRVGQRAGGDNLIDQGGHEHLLAHDAVQVATRQIMALADKRQGLCAVEGGIASREIGARQRLIHGVVQADLHAADSVREQDEAEQTDFRIVVDLDAGEVRDRVDKPLLSCLSDLLLELTAFDALAHELLTLLRGVFPVHAVDLGVTEAAVAHVRVTRDGHGGGAGAVIGNADDNDRVRIQLTIGLTSIEAGELGLAERIALRVRTRIRPDEQDVHGTVRALEIVFVRATQIQVRVSQVGAQRAHRVVAHARDREDEYSQSGQRALQHRVTNLGQVFDA